MKQQRQLANGPSPHRDAAAYRALWQDLFHWFDEERSILIDATGTQSDSHRLTVSYSDAASQVLTLGKPVVEIASQPQISFIWQRDGGPTIQITPRFNQVGLAIESSHTEFLPILWFGPHIPDTAEDNARRYSDLSRKGESLPIAEAMRTEFPFLLELSTEFTSNGASIFATMAGRKEKVPVGLVSDGVNKLLGILIAIASIPNGTILLDQLEDGFYYDRLPSIWKLIHSFALTYAVQVFATTHSKESLEALRSLVEENPDDFCLLQAKRGEGSSTVNLIQGKFFGAALEQGTEIR